MFPSCTLRSIHHHLKFGLITNEFEVLEHKKEKGDYSWGNDVEKTYYILVRKAKPLKSKKLEEYFENEQKRD